MSDRIRRQDDDQRIQDALCTLLGELPELLNGRPRLAGAIHTIAEQLLKEAAAAINHTSGQDSGSEATRCGPLQAAQTADTDAPFAADDDRPLVPEVPVARLAELPEITAAPSFAEPGPATPGESSKPRYSDVTDDDLSVMAQRCRMKAEGTLWALEREDRLRNNADFHDEIRPTDNKIIQRARQVPNCFLWMNQPRDDIWTRAGDYDLIADCFDALAESLTVLDDSLDTGTADQFLQAVNLTAEAQSALRTAVARVEGFPDSDQQMAYHWLRNRAGQDRFYIARFMKISDPADPDRAESIVAEATALQAALQADPAGTTAPLPEQRDVA